MEEIGDAMKVYLSTRTGLYEAVGEWDGQHLIVKKGSRIKKELSIEYRFPELITKYWEDKELFDNNGLLCKDVIFDNPSSAAQFVTKNSANGWKLWKTKEGKNLKSLEL